MLTIEHANKSQHDGVYTCRFSNLIDTAEWKIEVDIRSVEDVNHGIIAAIVTIVAIVCVLACLLARKMYADKVIYLSSLLVLLMVL